MIGSYELQPHKAFWPLIQILVLLAAAITPGATVRSAEDEMPEINVVPGFKVDLIYTVPQEQGSWVSLAFDPSGRLIASDQAGLLYRLTFGIGAGGKPSKIEPIRVFVKDANGKQIGEPIGAAQGLLWAFNCLYVVVNGSGGVGSGLYRLRATHGDDTLDDARLLAEIPSSGEHSPHGIVLSPDQKYIYLTAGDDCSLPTGSGSHVPLVWGGDQLLSPENQAKEWHSKSGIVPGGWVCRTDPEGKVWEVVCAGIRNSYRLACSPEGEIFGYDNDDEWQMGMPYYRPPRIFHVMGGADFGWRGGSQKWPAYFPDSLPPVLDLPRGGPSGLLIGTGAKFPAKYQRALFAVDWAYGKIYAVYLKPVGSSYTASYETFLSGRPLAIADAAIGSDGAMYFVTGGREIESKLFRIRYTGSESTVPAAVDLQLLVDGPRELRHTLEALQGQKNTAAIDTVWPHLDNPDPFIRAAARAVLEVQDVQQYSERVLKENRTQTLLTSMLALARCGDKTLQSKLLNKLGQLEWPKLSSAQRIELLRGYALLFIRMGKPDPDTAWKLAAQLNVFYPSGDDLVDRELSRVLVFLNAPELIEKTLVLLEKNPPPAPVEQMHLGSMLGSMKIGWTLPQRERYFQWFNRAAFFRGGREIHDVLADLKKQALENAPAERREALSAILKPESIGLVSTPRQLVKVWKVADLKPILKEKGLHGRNYERGRNVYLVSCLYCHYFNGEGQEIGPDLTSVGCRFDTGAILESIIEPSKVIADHYRNKKVTLRSGKTMLGRILAETNGKYEFAPDPMKPTEFIDIDKSDVTKIVDSPVSIMPEELLNAYGEDEILDLMAFLVSGGDAQDRVFQK